MIGCTKRGRLPRYVDTIVEHLQTRRGEQRRLVFGYDANELVKSHDPRAERDYEPHQPRRSVR